VGARGQAMTDDHCITFLKKLTGIDVDLANPLPVLNWMREHMPEEWEEYLLHIFSTTWTLKLSDDLFRILDLRNLVQYLKEHTEAPFMWGFTPCPSFPSCMSGETDKCDFPDKGCEGDGKVK
jgi:hypothetical protein